VTPTSTAPVGTAAPLSADTVVFNADRTGHREIHTMRIDGSGLRTLTSSTSFDSWYGRISPDRTKILFYRTPVNTRPDDEYYQTSLWMMNSDGSDQHVIHPAGADNWIVQGHAEWSPDGQQLVMFGGPSYPQIFVTDTAGRILRQVTDRPGLNVDPSWSPDGRTIVFSGCPTSSCTESDCEIYTVPASGGVATRLTNNSRSDHDAYFSPDGQTIAWLVETDPSTHNGAGAWEIYAMRADASNQRALTTDGFITSKPEWSRDGGRILFHRYPWGLSDHWSIYSVRTDGSDLKNLTSTLPFNCEFPGT
jgi:TolB protein